MTIYRYGQPTEDFVSFYAPVVGHSKNIQTSTQFEEIRKKDEKRDESLSERSTRRKRISSIKKERRKMNNQILEDVFQAEREEFNNFYGQEVELSK